MVDEKNIGKKVTWQSQARGGWTEKTGKIVGICHEGECPLTMAEIRFPKHRIMFDSVIPVAKGKERYFIEVKIGKQKPRLYYPMLKNLEIKNDSSYSPQLDEHND